MSSITNPHTSIVPVNQAPRGKNTSALATAPAVPTIVMASGVTPARDSRVASGLTRFSKKVLA
jgi:hypothetical protein